MAALDDKYNIPGTYCIVDKSDQFNDEGRMTRSADEFYSQIIISVPTRPKKVPAVTLVSFNCQCCPCIKTFPQRWKCWDKSDISLASVWWLPIATETSSTTWIWAFWVWWLFKQTQQCKMWQWQFQRTKEQRKDLRGGKRDGKRIHKGKVGELALRKWRENSIK